MLCAKGREVPIRDLIRILIVGSGFDAQIAPWTLEVIYPRGHIKTKQMWHFLSLVRSFSCKSFICLLYVFCLWSNIDHVQAHSLFSMFQIRSRDSRNVNQTCHQRQAKCIPGMLKISSGSPPLAVAAGLPPASFLWSSTGLQGASQRRSQLESAVFNKQSVDGKMRW